MIEQSMKLFVKVKNGFVKLVETKKEVDTSFISDEGGQISSMRIIISLIVYQSCCQS